MSKIGARSGDEVPVEPAHRDAWAAILSPSPYRTDPSDNRDPGSGNQALNPGDTGFDEDERVRQGQFTPAILPVWRTLELELELDQVPGRDRLVAWMGARRNPLLAGASSLAVSPSWLEWPARLRRIGRHRGSLARTRLRKVAS